MFKHFALQEQYLTSTIVLLFKRIPGLVLFGPIVPFFPQILKCSSFVHVCVMSAVFVTSFVTALLYVVVTVEKLSFLEKNIGPRICTEKSLKSDVCVYVANVS